MSGVRPVAHIVEVEGMGFYTVCSCGVWTKNPEGTPERAAAQAERFDEYRDRVGMCRHEEQKRDDDLKPDVSGSRS